MSDLLFNRYVEQEVKYHARKEICKQIRNNCSDSDPFTTGVTVMIGSILAMAALSALLKGNSRGRMR